MERTVDALGPTGHRVGRQLGRLRRQRGLTQGELAELLNEAGRPIALAALSKIEKGQRRVDADDLVALALVLDVPPNELLFSDSDSVTVELTSTKSLPSDEVWRWATRDQSKPDRGVFISYVGADKAWAEWIAWQLAEAGEDVLLDVWELTAGDNFVRFMENGISNAKCVIAILSSSYVSSERAEREWTAAISGSGSRMKNRFLPVRVENSPMPSTLEPFVYLDLVSRTEEEARRLLLEAVASFGRGRRKPTSAPGFPL